jgi:cation transport ATPase
MKLSEKFWGKTLQFLLFCFVSFGAGYEIYTGIRDKHMHSSFLMTVFSMLIFIASVFYCYASGAIKPVKANIYGAIVMFIMVILHLYFNR